MLQRSIAIVIPPDCPSVCLSIYMSVTRRYCDESSWDHRSSPHHPSFRQAQLCFYVVTPRKALRSLRYYLLFLVLISFWQPWGRLQTKTNKKAVRCRCIIRYVSKFTAASCGSPCDSTALSSTVRWVQCSMASGFNFYSSFKISRIIILDIRNNYSGYPELDVYFGYPE